MAVPAAAAKTALKLTFFKARVKAYTEGHKDGKIAQSAQPVHPSDCWRNCVSGLYSFTWPRKEKRRES